MKSASPVIFLAAAFVTAGPLVAQSLETAFSYDAAGNITNEVPVAVSAPVITTHSSDRFGQVGGTASFNATATGFGPLTYQWRRNGIAIPGATGATLFLENLVRADFAGYSVVVTNGAGSVTVSVAQLTLDADDDGLADAWPILPLDTSFAPTFTIGKTDYLEVHDMVRQPDGKVLVTGRFDAINGVARNKIARLNADGALDTAFKGPQFQQGIGGALFNTGTVRAIGVQSDGKVLVAGYFSHVNGAGSPPVVRLLADGSPDSSFVAPAFDSSGLSQTTVYCLTVQPDGKILIGGDFSSLSGVPRLRVARLWSNGVLDSSFDTSAVANGTVFAMARQSDGSVLIGGNFTQVGAVARSRIARLTGTGALDGSFDPGAVSFDAVHCLLVDSSGRVLAGGKVPNSTVPPIIRLTSTGALDNTFSVAKPGFYVVGPVVRDLVEQPDGKILAVGLSIYGVSGGDVTYLASGIARLSDTGILDTGFVASIDDGGYSNLRYANTLLLPGDGSVWFGGKFTGVNATAQINLSRVDAAGVVQPFPLPLSASESGYYARVTAVAPYLDGRLIVCGDFDLVNGVRCEGLGRLLPDGTLDTTFNAGRKDGSRTGMAVLLPDGKLMVNSRPLARLNADGSRDTAFNPPSNVNLACYADAIAVQQDGKLIIGGIFNSITPLAKYIARLDSTGALDSTFAAQANGAVSTVDLRADGKILLGGSFTTVNGTVRRGIARLLPDGQLDAAFTTGVEPALMGVNDVRFGDGYTMMGGSFAYSNSTRRGFAVLDESGALDPNRNAGGFFHDGSISKIQPRRDGGFWVGGNFTGVDGPGLGYSSPNLALLLPTGALDTKSFQMPDAGVQALHERANRELIIGGWFGQVGGQDRLGLARYVTTGRVNIGSIVTTPGGSDFPLGSDITMTITATALDGPVAEVQFESSTDGENFARFRTGALIGGNTWQAVATLTTTGTFHLRAAATDSLGNRRTSYIHGPLRVFDPVTMAELTSLVPGAGILNPAFTGGITNYTVIVPNTTASITLTPTVLQSTATIRINGIAVVSGAASGPINLTLGNNTINTVVTAQNGTTTTTYTVIVNRSPLGDALDTSGLTWSTGGDQSWFAQMATTHDGVDALQSGSVNATDEQESWVETTVTGPGTLTFWWKVSSPAGSPPGTPSDWPGHLEFLVTGVETGAEAHWDDIFDNVDWMQKSVFIPAGRHVLRWRYWTDDIVSNSASAGWLDEVVFTEIPVLAIADWRQQHFGSPANSGNGADLFDFDRDGLVNLIEFAMGLNPTLESSRQLPQGQIVGANFVISFAEPAGISGITYSAEWSASMGVGSWNPVTDSGVNGQHTFSVPVGASPSRFVRLRFTRF